ncbi:MAG: T9SS type A sorting domain-containing protein [Chitinophagales bacterium]|nr:T9SS type A sorting domain-containing protein [Chitinophagales bacterium]
MKSFYSLVTFITLSASLMAQAVTDTVSTGASYANQVWYSLNNDEVARSSKDNWDIAFEAEGFTASILVNTQKGLALYQTPFGVADWASFDTTGLSTWEQLIDSDTSWGYGAFNHSSMSTFDLGWGTYNLNTHVVTGDSIYALKLANGDWKKIKIDQLANGVYDFTYADVDGSNEVSASIAKDDMLGKSFGYYSFADQDTVMREPNKDAWDITFTRYSTIINAPAPTVYSVTGVLANQGVLIAEATGVDVNTVNYNGLAFGTEINTIGYDWKAYDNVNMVFTITDSLAYFVQLTNGEIWKLVFTGFGGSSNGNYIFSKELVYDPAVTGIEDLESKAQMLVYPNPSNGTNTELVYSIGNAVDNAVVNVYDLTGRNVLSTLADANTGLHRLTLNTANLVKGMYIVRLSTGSAHLEQKLIIE